MIKMTKYPKHEEMLKQYMLTHVCIYEILEFYDINTAPEAQDERCLKYQKAAKYHCSKACLLCFHDWLKEDIDE